jgi:hypothetical protein
MIPTLRTHMYPRVPETIYIFGLESESELSSKPDKKRLQHYRKLQKDAKRNGGGIVDQDHTNSTTLTETETSSPHHEYPYGSRFVEPEPSRARCFWVK